MLTSRSNADLLEKVNLKISKLINNHKIMKKFYFFFFKRSIIVFVLLLSAPILFAQDNLNRLQSQDESKSFIKVLPASIDNSDQYTGGNLSNLKIDQNNSVHFIDIPSHSQKFKGDDEIMAYNLGCDGTPIGIEDGYGVEKGKALVVPAPGVLINDIDPGGGTVQLAIFTSAAHGTISDAVKSGAFSYTPDANFTGLDHFQYKILDSNGNLSEYIDVHIQVFEPFKRMPLGVTDRYGTRAGTPININAPGVLANDIDPDGDTISLATISNPSNGKVSNSKTSGSFTYTPNNGFTGTDQFQYKILDSDGNLSEYTNVYIEVFEAFKRMPIGFSDHYGTLAETPLNIGAPGLLGNDTDPDGDVITLAMITGALHGSISNAVTSGSFTYTPDAGFTGEDQFMYKLLDSKGNLSEFVDVTIDVIVTGDLPYGFDDDYVTQKNQALTIAAPGVLANDMNVNGNGISLSVITNPTNGVISNTLISGGFIYTPDIGFTGTDIFTYKMLDRNGNPSDYITVIIHVLRAPFGVINDYITQVNEPLHIDAPSMLKNDLNPERDAFTLAIITNPANGNISDAVTSGTFTYTPDANFTGSDQFQYKSLDSEGNLSEFVTVNIEVVESFNRKPLGVGDNYFTQVDEPLHLDAPGILINDIDPDGDAISLAIITKPPHGNILNTVTNGSLTYTPNAGFSGNDSFTYKLLDSEGNLSDPVIVTIEVSIVNQSPVAMAADIVAECAGSRGTTVTLDGSGSVDPDGGALQFRWSENGTIIAGPSAFPNAKVTLSTRVHTITLEVEDECGSTSSVDFTVTVEDTSPPVIAAELLPAHHPHEYEISCSAKDVCSAIVASSSVIRIPVLTNPSVSLKNNKNYSVSIDLKKNKVEVKAPDASAFWSMIQKQGGVEVDDGQVIDIKTDKHNYDYQFDKNGTLISVKGEEITLKCTATDSNGNTGEDEATLSPETIKTYIVETENKSDDKKASKDNDITISKDEYSDWHRNYPNPFKSKTKIEFKLETPAFVKVSIFNQSGKLVQLLSNRHMPIGVQEVIWDASRQKSGIYYYRIEYNGYYISDKMILVE